MKSLKTIILAAGRGVRMNSDIPKVLHQVCGKVLIQYVIDLAKNLRSLKIYVVLGFKNEVVQNSLSKDLQIVVQKKLLGTADAIRCTQSFFSHYSGDVLILSGDTPLLTRETVQKVIQRHRKSKAKGTFLTAHVSNPHGYGRIIRDGARKVVAIREEKDATLKEKEISEINVGVYCFDSKILFDLIRRIQLNEKKMEFYLTDIIDLLVRKNCRIETVCTENYQEGLGVNTREDLHCAERIVRNKILNKIMRQGVTIVDPQTTYIEENVKIGKDTIIRPFTFIEKDVFVGNRCLIGPFSRLRSGTRISDDVEIGNFSEISRTQIGKKSIMKHFGFLGDSKLGKRVNIGAGTITANFDGINKNTTTIQDDAFIGSDSILIAPVNIGKKAATGAGSVVTRNHDVLDGKVVAGVPAREISRRNF